MEIPALYFCSLLLGSLSAWQSWMQHTCYLMFFVIWWLWPLTLEPKIGTPITPALGRVRTNSGFLHFLLLSFEPAPARDTYTDCIGHNKIHTSFFFKFQLLYFSPTHTTLCHLSLTISNSYQHRLKIRFIIQNFLSTSAEERRFIGASIRLRHLIEPPSLSHLSLPLPFFIFPCFSFLKSSYFCDGTFTVKFIWCRRPCYVATSVCVWCSLLLR